MITAVDSNILLDVLTGDRAAFQLADAALDVALRAGGLTVCIIVYAEIVHRFVESQTVDDVLRSLPCTVTQIELPAARLSAQYFRAYRQRGGDRTRILPDFLIAAHARLQAGQFLTRDARFFGDHFDGLHAVHPTDFTV